MNEPNSPIFLAAPSVSLVVAIRDILVLFNWSVNSDGSGRISCHTSLNLNNSLAASLVVTEPSFTPADKCVIRPRKSSIILLYKSTCTLAPSTSKTSLVAPVLAAS